MSWRWRAGLSATSFHARICCTAHVAAFREAWPVLWLAAGFTLNFSYYGMLPLAFDGKIVGGCEILRDWTIARGAKKSVRGCVRWRRLWRLP
jgi:hypothetical protein